jgi:hypothetical protein
MKVKTNVKAGAANHNEAQVRDSNLTADEGRTRSRYMKRSAYLVFVYRVGSLQKCCRDRMREGS